MALRELLVERFRGIRSARLTLDPTTVLLGENDCGKSSLLEALALVLSPLGERLPRVKSRQFHRGARECGAAPVGPVCIQVTLGETRAGSWDRPDLEALAPVLGRKGADLRTLVVELTADPPAGDEAIGARWEILNPGGRGIRDDPDALEAVRRLNPLVWLRGGALVRTAAPSAAGAGEAGPTADTLSDAALVLRSYERLLGGETPSHEDELDSGYAAAERLLAEWAPAAQDRRAGTRAAVAEVLGRALEPPRAEQASGGLPGAAARKLGVLLLTAGLFQHLRVRAEPGRKGAAPGVRPIIVIEDPEMESRRLTVLADRDIEHSFWRHGHAHVFERLAGAAADPGGASPGRVIGKAIDRHSKPGVAFELLASVAAAGSAGAPPPLRRTIEACVALARGAAAGGLGG